MDAAIIIFRVSRRRREMYIGQCVLSCVSVPHRIPTLLHRPGCNLGNGRGAPHLCTIGRKICNQCTGFVAKTTYANAKCQQLLVLHVCLVSIKDPSSLASIVSDTLPLSSIATSNMQFVAMFSVSSLVLTRDLSSMAGYLALCL